MDIHTYIHQRTVSIVDSEHVFFQELLPHYFSEWYRSRHSINSQITKQVQTHTNIVQDNTNYRQERNNIWRQWIILVYRYSHVGKNRSAIEPYIDRGTYAKYLVIVFIIYTHTTHLIKESKSQVSSVCMCCMCVLCVYVYYGFLVHALLSCLE